MAEIPKQTLVQRIDAVTIESYPRPHLGASMIGSACKRSLVYMYYWSSKVRVSGKLNRIFRTGDDVELRLVEALASVGVTVTRSQDRVVDETGHAGGSIDGVAIGVDGFDELLFEGKSMNHTNFLELVRKQVQAAKPTHYVQMQMYMARLGIPFALYMALDKNTSEIYTEIVPFDEPCFLNHKDLELHILQCDHIEEFPRISSNPSWFACKFCDFKHICHDGDLIAENCRTCDSSSMVEGGTWHCAIKNKELSVEDQAAGCSEYVLSEMWK